MPKIRELVLQFYNQLEGICQEHKELTDTDVRETLYAALNYYFIWGKPTDRLPVNYSMLSVKGNKDVADALEDFIKQAQEMATAEDIPVGQPRFEILQDDSITTKGGETYDLFIGFSEEIDEPYPPYERMYHYWKA
jgi:hypothetical protein